METKISTNLRCLMEEEQGDRGYLSFFFFENSMLIW